MKASSIIQIFLAGILVGFFIGAYSLKTAILILSKKSSTTEKPTLSLQGAEAPKPLSSFCV